MIRFKLHAGSEVQVKDRRDDWLRIALPDVGRSGVRGGGGAVAACSGVCVTSTGRLGREGRPAGGLGRPGQDSSLASPGDAVIRAWKRSKNAPASPRLLPWNRAGSTVLSSQYESR